MRIAGTIGESPQEGRLADACLARDDDRASGTGSNLAKVGIERG